MRGIADAEPTRVLLRVKLTPVLRVGEWRVFDARLKEDLVRRTVREHRFTNGSSRPPSLSPFSARS